MAEGGILCFGFAGTKTIAQKLDDEAREMWSQGKISGDEALAAIHFIEKFKTLLTPTTK